MWSSFEEDEAHQPAKDCKELFDDLFFENDDNLQVKKPTRTYGGPMRRGLLNIGQRSAHDDVDGGDSDRDDQAGDNDAALETAPGRKTNKQVKKKAVPAKRPPRKKATNQQANNNKNKKKVPLQDAVLKAFREAQQKGELPDFEEIDKQELCIVHVAGSSGSSEGDQDIDIGKDETVAELFSRSSTSSSPSEVAINSREHSLFDNEENASIQQQQKEQQKKQRPTRGTTKLDLDLTSNVISSNLTSGQNRRCLRSIGNLGNISQHFNQSNIVASSTPYSKPKAKSVLHPSSKKRRTTRGSKKK